MENHQNQPPQSAILIIKDIIILAQKHNIPSLFISWENPGTTDALSTSGFTVGSNPLIQGMAQVSRDFLSEVCQTAKEEMSEETAAPDAATFGPIINYFPN